MIDFSLQTRNQVEMLDITDQVREAVRKSGVESGMCFIYCPHTTAGITINENADPDVQSDMVAALGEMVPHMHFSHAEGNSPAHVQSSIVGCSEHVLVHSGKLMLGTWQGIYFCEFDGPRSRSFYVKVFKGN